MWHGRSVIYIGQCISDDGNNPFPTTNPVLAQCPFPKNAVLLRSLDDRRTVRAEPRERYESLRAHVWTSRSAFSAQPATGHGGVGATACVDCVWRLSKPARFKHNVDDERLTFAEPRKSVDNVGADRSFQAPLQHQPRICFNPPPFHLHGPSRRRWVCGATNNEPCNAACHVPTTLSNRPVLDFPGVESTVSHAHLSASDPGSGWRVQRVPSHQVPWQGLLQQGAEPQRMSSRSSTSSRSSRRARDPDRERGSDQSSAAAEEKRGNPATGVLDVASGEEWCGKVHERSEVV